MPLNPNDKRRYLGPRITRDQAVELAWQFVIEHDLPAGVLQKIQHGRPVIYGRADDTFEGWWEVTIESLVPPDPPNTVTSPRPDAPFIFEINDQTGKVTLFMRL